jgi:hypothetical protein
MRKARAFFVVCAGIFLLAPACRLGVTNARAQTGVGAIAGEAAPVGVPSPANCTVPAVVDSPYQAVIRDIGNFPIANMSVTLGFDRGAGANPCSTSACTGCVWDSVTRSLWTWTDPNGVASFPISVSAYTGPCFPVSVTIDNSTSIGTTNWCGFKARKRALVISGEKHALYFYMIFAENWAVLKYLAAGWDVIHFTSSDYSDPEQALELLVRSGGPWNAIDLVAHGSYEFENQTGQWRGFFILDGTGDIAKAPHIDDLATWFRASTPDPPDEVILNACELGKVANLSEQFRNPRYFKSWDYLVSVFHFWFFERFRHWPPGGSVDEPSVSQTRAQSSPESRLALSDGACIGGICGDGTCLDFAPAAQAVVDSALAAMESGAAYGDSIQARAKLVEARDCFARALVLETDPDRRWVLESHVRDISDMLDVGSTNVPGEASLAFALDPVRPNPTRGGSLTVHFTLPTSAAASIELIDVAGRRIVRREVGTFGAGPHALDIGEGRRIEPGFYLVRLRQGTDTRVTRAVVLR